jgi:hypothetical protein
MSEKGSTARFAPAQSCASTMRQSMQYGGLTTALFEFLT